MSEHCLDTQKYVKKNGFEKFGRSICMEPPPLGTPTRVFLRACAINNREWARDNNPAWAHPHNRRKSIDFQHITTFTLCKSETLWVYAHVRVCGCALGHVGAHPTPPSTPISERNCHSHMDSLPRPLAPIMRPTAPECTPMSCKCVGVYGCAHMTNARSGSFAAYPLWG